MKARMQHVLYYHNKTKISKLADNQRFVFGSNSLGRHGAGAAQDAFRYFGAKYRQAHGLQGQSYGIVTRDYLERKENNSMFADLSLKRIKMNVDLFFQDAKRMPDLLFVMTEVGCGRAGYHASEIAPLFEGAPPNVLVPANWVEYIPHREAILVAI